MSDLSRTEGEHHGFLNEKFHTRLLQAGRFVARACRHCGREMLRGGNAEKAILCPSCDAPAVWDGFHG